MSYRPCAVSFIDCSGLMASSDAIPSVCGTWAIAAAALACFAMAMTWPPERDDPHNTIRDESTSVRALA